MALMLEAGNCLLIQAIGGNHPPVLITGIVLKLLGLAGVSANYLLYKKLLERDRQEYAYDIVQLADQIIKATDE